MKLNIVDNDDFPPMQPERALHGFSLTMIAKQNNKPNLDFVAKIFI